MIFLLSRLIELCLKIKIMNAYFLPCELCKPFYEKYSTIIL
ncbi:hypothetical protein OENI_30080 [Oenococcus oeni]|nr:hypothetical protein OENI_10403 [Oenococcus oeni]SYV99188.1 hypothetical protein OENI_140028 [Oenococcus oeni]SYW02109.1 hypothetical protein OENI_30080 [Oenococcus oeni]SYW15103.1 hypothetical protein OENI_90012 [Oenococcus oeni]SYW18041.1 hypothetical protein OENI_20111 [Oenococcus oeni]